MKADEAQVKTSASAMLSERHPTLSGMFSPKSVAVIGASEMPGSVGRALMENLQSFRGRVSAVNPNHSLILEQRANVVPLWPITPPVRVIFSTSACENQHKKCPIFAKS